MDCLFEVVVPLLKAGVGFKFKTYVNDKKSDIGTFFDDVKLSKA